VSWWTDGRQLTLNGAALATVGVQIPAQWPENAMLLDVTAID
jgi:alpha-galactosidase